MTGWSLSPPLADPRLHLAHLLFKSPIKSHHSKPNIPTPQEQSKKQPSLQESQGEKPSLLEFGVWKAMRTIAALTVLPHSPEDLCVLQIFTEKPVLVDVECCFSPQCCSVLLFCFSLSAVHDSVWQPEQEWDKCSPAAWFFSWQGCNFVFFFITFIKWFMC